VGKKNLVNNFCVAIPSNEARCAQCHAGYGYKDSKFDFTDKGAIDCLACHSTKYSKDKKLAGAPAATVDMVTAAQSVGAPTRATCGRCHFGAGGGDNVKKGDLGSAMTTPAAAADVHMGSAKGAFVCADCHATGGHKLVGQGAHLPVSEGRVDCVDCHGAAPHADSKLNNHALDVACQTCHIPAFSRQQPTKMDWDWSTAGNKTIGTDGVKKTTVGGTSVDEYNYMKGTFVWKKDVQPVFGWYDSRVERMTLNDAYTTGEGTKTKPIQLSKLVATKKDSAAKIFPFKLMKGRQPVDTTTRKVLAPKLFGKTGFWGLIPAASAYKAQDVEDLWTATLTLGAVAAGQIKSTEKFTGRATGAKPWDWAYTSMHLAINHEVAPKTKALGCTKCHGTSTGNWDWKALGYTCDPMNDATKCGSRHK
jgi:octaheme c-type cytochrome (tetrathionate reductase family)